MAQGLTARQAQVLEFIESFRNNHGYPPTVREVAGNFGFRSPRAAHDHMKALERKGFLRSVPGRPRALEVVGSLTGIPMLGRIAAGQPILAVEETDNVLSLDPGFFGRGKLFALTVKGDSMIEDHITEGDTVIMRSQDNADNGEVVAALVGEEVTLKRLQKMKGKVHLVPANSSMQPIEVGPDDDDLRILGVMVGLVRKV